MRVITHHRVRHVNTELTEPCGVDRLSQVSTILGVAIPQQREERAYIDGIAIWGAVIVVIAVGAGNDYHKELQFRKLNAAKDILQTKVVRDGLQKVVPSTELVVGDLVLLDTGKYPYSPSLPSFFQRSPDEAEAQGAPSHASSSASGT